MTPAPCDPRPPHVVQISSGGGPQEVRAFVALLVEEIARRLEDGGARIVATGRTGDAQEPRSASLTVECEAEVVLPFLGTHELVARSPRRSRRSRKRWYAGVTLHKLPEVAAPLDPDDVIISAIRSGGPGGQHVNRTASAVRAQHRPSGLAVRVEEERSQHANRRLALRRLAEALEAQATQPGEGARSERHSAHAQLERGRPVCSWALDASGQLVPRTP